MYIVNFFFKMSRQYNTLSFIPFTQNLNINFLNKNSCWLCKHSFLDMHMGLRCKKFTLPDSHYKRTKYSLYSNNFDYTYKCRMDEKKCGPFGKYFEPRS